MNKLTSLISASLALSRVLFLLYLPVMMAFHAGTLPSSGQILELTLLGLIGFYIISRLLEGSPWPCLKTGLALLTLLLVGVGWLAAGYPSSRYDQHFRVFLPLAGGDYFWPWGAVDGPLAFRAMLRISGIAGAFLMAWDMAEARFWRKGLLATLAWTGVAMSIFGLGQKVAGGTDVYWGKVSNYAFGSFWYHGNAGAFLNLCWPLLAGLTFVAFMEHRKQKWMGQMRRAVCLLGLLILLTSVWVNVSKAGQAIFCVQAFSLIFCGIWYARKTEWHISQGSWILTGVFGVLLVFGSLIFGLNHGLERWKYFFDQGMSDARWRMLTVCTRWIQEAGLFGFGPGTFAAVFSVKTTGLIGSPKGYWQFAHNDYIQTALEWGWLGLILWISLFWGAFIRSTRQLWSLPIESVGSRVLKVCVLIALISVAVHAAIDFPLQMFGIQLFTAALMGWAVTKSVEHRLPRTKKERLVP